MSESVRMGTGALGDGTLMDKQYPPEAWKRLGRALEARRGELGYGFRQRGKFLADHGGAPPSVKTLARLERGERTSYPPATITRLESLYECAPGSFEAFLADGGARSLPVASRPASLRPVPSPPAAARPAVEVLVALLARHPEDEGLAADVVAGLLSLYPDDDTMAAMAEVGLRRGKAPSRVVGEILEWLAFLDRAEGRPENGTAG